MGGEVIERVDNWSEHIGTQKYFKNNINISQS